MSYKIPKNAIQLHVSQVKLGMFVSALDKSWLETPFLVQGLLVRSQSDIDALAEHTKFVWIDPLQQSLKVMQTLKSIAPEQFSKRAETEFVALDKHGSLRVNQKTYSKSQSLEEEQSIAQGIYERGKLVIHEVLAAASVNIPPDKMLARNLVKECLDSILRNPDALLWMTKIREEDEYTAEHCLSVCILSLAFGRYLGLNESELVQLGLCGLLHDVGKMQVPLDILNKPGKLTAEEFAQIKNHTLRGYELLSASSQNLSTIIAETALSHHERIDARGYPKKISASDLPELIRIISIVDAYDAMTADRCYSAAKTTTTALKIIYEEAGKQFDQNLALAFIRCIGIYPPGTLVELINGCIGVVLDVNEKYRHLPRIIVLRDTDGKTDAPYLINLIDIEFGDLSNEYLVKSTLKSGSYSIDTKKIVDQFSDFLTKKLS